MTLNYVVTRLCLSALPAWFWCPTRLMSMVTELPHLPEVEQVSPLVLRIIAGNPSKFTLQGKISVRAFNRR